MNTPAVGTPKVDTRTRRHRARRFGTPFFPGALLAALTACGELSAPEAEPAQVAALGGAAQRVSVTAADTPEVTERRYGGEVVVWRPEAGFAILELAGRAGLTFESAAEPNAVVTGSDRSWSGGLRSWSGGNTSGDAVTLEQNRVSWDQIRSG